MKSVISCPRCLRQYSIESSVKMARCAACKSHFAVAIAELTSPCEAEELVSPVRPHFNFLFQAATEAARSVKTIFELAGEPFLPESVVRFLGWLPHSLADMKDEAWQETYTNQIMRRAYQASYQIDRTRAHEAVIFFEAHARSYDSDALDTLIGAFAGVLSVEYDRPKSTEIALIPRRKRRFDRLRKAVGWVG